MPWGFEELPGATKGKNMKISLLITIFLILSSVNAMIPGSIEDVDYELCYMEMIISNLESSFQDLNSITDYQKGIRFFKDLCVRYRTMNEHPIWITEISSEPEEEKEKQQISSREEK